LQYTSIHDNHGHMGVTTNANMHLHAQTQICNYMYELIDDSNMHLRA